MDDLDPALLDRLDAAGFPWAGCTACPVVACHAPTCHNGRDRSARGVLWVCVVLFRVTVEPPGDPTAEVWPGIPARPPYRFAAYGPRGPVRHDVNPATAAAEAWLAGRA